MLAAYGVGVRRAGARGAHWPALRTAIFVVLGVGSYAVVDAGLPRRLCPYLRWAFAAQAALLLLVVPALLAIGRPIALAREALGDSGKSADWTAFLAGRLVRVLSHPIGGPALLLVVLLLFLTPLPPEVRNHASALAVTQIAAALLRPHGPAARGLGRGTGEHLDDGDRLPDRVLRADRRRAPGILLRLHNGIIGTLAVPGARPPWLPTALRDQQLSGDVLWFLGEAIDLPFLAWLVRPVDPRRRQGGGGGRRPARRRAARRPALVGGRAARPGAASELGATGERCPLRCDRAGYGAAW